MNHDELQISVMSLLDGELPEAQRADARKHLESCRACQVVADEFMTASRLLSTAPVPDSDRFVWTVMSRVREIDAHAQPRLRTAFHRWFAPLSAAVAFSGYIMLLTTPASGSLPATDEILVSEAREMMPSDWIVVPRASDKGHVLDDEGEE